MRAVKAHDRSAVNLGEQVVDILGDHVDEIGLKRILFRERGAVQDRILGQLAVAPALVSDGPQRGCRVVFDLLFHGSLQFAAQRQDRLRSPGVRAWSHCGHVRRNEDDEACRSRMAAAGRNVGYDRNRRGKNRLHDLVGRLQHASGRVEAQHHGFIARGPGRLQAGGHDFSSQGVDDRV